MEAGSRSWGFPTPFADQKAQCEQTLILADGRSVDINSPKHAEGTPMQATPIDTSTIVSAIGNEDVFRDLQCASSHEAIV